MDQINLGSVATAQIENVYDGCEVVYDANGGQYVLKAAELFESFIKNSSTLPVSVRSSNETAGSESAENLKVYIGNTGKIPAKTFVDDGYYVGLDKEAIILVGANAQSTYYAVSRFIDEHCKDNPDMITNANIDGGFERSVVDREQYINDISKLPLVWEYEWTPMARFMDFEEKITSFNDTSSNRRAMAIAHRGDIECYPENSIEGIISATRKGADAIEIDCCLTKDGVFVLNHGLSLNANTDWSLKRGKTVNGMLLPTSSYVFDWTLIELQQLNLRFGNGLYANSNSEVSAYKIATLEEAFKVVKNRTSLVLDQVNKNLENESNTEFEANQRGINNPYWTRIYAIAKSTGAYRSILGSNFAYTLSEANSILNVIKNEFSVTCPNQFLRTGYHNSVIDWYAEFDLTTAAEFDALYSSYLTVGVTQGGATAIGDFIMGNRLTRILEWINRNYV